MISFPNAKINLGLNILRKREDGYHEIESCFYPIPWNDTLEILESDQFSFKSYGLEIQGDATSNLCVRAYELLKADFSIPPVEIHLLKSIPMGAGLGGGSADGTFTLTMLNELFELGISKPELETYSLQLGSDCPFFANNTSAIVSGRGELLRPTDLDLRGRFLAIQNPGIHISTQEAYSGVNITKQKKSIPETLNRPIEDWKDLLSNDFEASIFPNHPKISELKDEMYQAGAQYSSMTGSGSTVYGIFQERPDHKQWKILNL